MTVQGPVKEHNQTECHTGGYGPTRALGLRLKEREAMRSCGGGL